MSSKRKNSLFNYFCSKPEYAAKKTGSDDQTEAVSTSMCSTIMSSTITSTGSGNEHESSDDNAGFSQTPVTSMTMVTSIHSSASSSTALPSDMTDIALTSDSFPTQPANISLPATMCNI